MTVTIWPAEVPPPGEPVKTVTLSLAGVVRSEVGTMAVNWLALTYVVASAVPLKSAVDPLTKLLPVRVMVVAAAPTVAELGLMPVSVGAGFDIGVGVGVATPMLTSSMKAVLSTLTAP